VSFGVRTNCRPPKLGTKPATRDCTLPAPIHPTCASARASVIASPDFLAELGFVGTNPGPRCLLAHCEEGLKMAGNLTYRSQLNPVEVVVLASSFALIALVAVLAWH
jgi:hypothetical protein